MTETTVPPAREVPTVILGAAGRDFHNFNMLYRDDPATRVVAFTATQIPGTAGRRYPPSLCRPALSRGHEKTTRSTRSARHRSSSAVSSTIGMYAEGESPGLGDLVAAIAGSAARPSEAS